MIRFILLCIFCLSAAQGITAPVHLETGNDYKITQEAQFLWDKTGDLSHQDALSRSEWQPIETNRVNFGFIESPVWVRFSLTGAEATDWVMRITYPLLDYLDIYVLKDGEVLSQYNTGDLKPFHNRAFDHPQFSAPLPIQPGSIFQVLLRVDTAGAAELPIFIEEHETFKSENRIRDMARGFINGIFIIMLLYNLIIYIFIKDSSYAFYVLNVAVYIIQLNNFEGSGFQYFWPDNPEYNLYAFPFFNGLMQLTQFLFLVVFLEILKRKAWYVTPVKCFIAMMIPLPILGVVMEYQVIIPIQVMFAIFVNIAGLVFGLYYSLKGETSARYFTLAWFLFLLGLLIINLKSFGLIPNNIYTEYSYQIGAFIEMTLLSLALAQRIQSSQQKVIQLQNENIETLEKYQNLYQNSLSGQFQLDQSGFIYNMNPACYRMFSIENISQPITDDHKTNINDFLINDSDLSRIQDVLKNENKIINEEIQLKTRANETRWFSISIRPVKDIETGMQSYDVSVLDINERKVNDDIKEKSMMDRMSSLEQLAIGICHEINTPLGITVTASSHLGELIEKLKISFDKGQLTKRDMENYLADKRSALDMVEEGLNKTKHLMTQFKQVSVRQLGLQTSDSTVNNIINDAQTAVKSLTKENNVTFNIECSDQYTYSGHCIALRMILSELIENSVVHCENPQQGIQISIKVDQKDDNLEILYQDNGSGANLENTEELFNAFYTTKRGQNGRIGLGLYKVYNLATQLLKGTIEYEELDKPSFRIIFPSNQEQSSPDYEA